MTTLVIADDHAIIREGLKRILSKNKVSNEYSVIGEANSFRELQHVLLKYQPKILTLDLSMPGGSGLEALKDAKKAYPDLLVLILSLHPEEYYGLRAFKAGASGYLSKECAPEQLVEALHTILTGKRYFGKVTEDLIFNELERTKAPAQLQHAHLSDREFHVLIKLGEGRTLTQISKDLSLSVKTVSTYRLRVLNKMGIKTNTQITEYVVRHKISSSI